MAELFDESHYFICSNGLKPCAAGVGLGYCWEAMFHGKIAAGGGKDNHLKTITTRSGHTIEFDDADESQGITIKDVSGNVIHIDTKGKNMEITAPETITLNAKNININAAEDISMSAGADISEIAGGNVSQTAGAAITHVATDDYMLQAANITKNAIGNISTQAKTANKQAVEDVNISSSGGNVNKHAQQEVQNNSSTNANIH